MTSRLVIANVVSEKELQQVVSDALHVFHWRSYHSWLSIRSEPGWPDIFAVRGERLLAVELKREGKNPTERQAAWLGDLAAAGVECHVWRPSDWLSGRIEEALR